jgi:DNA invertase Pin-like site-specific DNA recombinase
MSSADNGNRPANDQPYRVAIYARYSSEVQNEISIEDQVTVCREEIARRGWRVVGVYTDSAQSGWSLDRDGFQEMRAAAEKGKIDAVMFWKFDRLARNHNHTVMIKALLRHQYGLKLFCVEGVSEDDDGSPYTAMVEQMIAVFAAFYSRNLSSDTKRAKRAKAMRGEFNGSVAPLGYVLVRKRDATEDHPAGLHVDPEIAPLVAQAFERYETGEYSDPDIAAWLNAQPAVQEARKGRKPLGKDTVRDMLQNRVYTGMVPYSETLYDGSSLGQKKKSRRGRIRWFEGRHEGIVSNRVFENCQVIREGLRRTYTNPSQMRTYILPDRVFCAHCLAEDQANLADPHFGKMRVAWYDRIQAAQYRCVARDRGYRKCSQGYVREETVLNQVVRILSEMKPPPEVMERIDATVKARESNADALEGVRKLEEQLERVQYSWEQGLLEPEKYIEKMHQLQREIASMRPLDYDRLEEAYDLITHFKTYWDLCAEVDSPEEARQQLMAKVIDRVFVYDDRVIAIALPPDLGIVLDVAEAAPNEVMAAVSAAAKHAHLAEQETGASVSDDTRTQHGSDGPGLLIGYMVRPSSGRRLSAFIIS